MTKLKFLLSLLLLVQTPGFSEERKEICAEYVSTGKKYKVQGIEMSGFELNSATTSLNYNILSKYIVIFWAPGQASVIELDSPFGVSLFETSGRDQSGRQWSVSTNITFCF